MYFNISQKIQDELEKPLHKEIYRKNAAAQIAPRTQTHTWRELAQSTHQDFPRNIRRHTLYGNLREKCRGLDWAQNVGTHFLQACAIKTIL
jgi:hypothetical protein